MAFSPPEDFHALTRLVQAAIRDRYYGFAPPGSCILVPGLSPNDYSCKVMAVCPTMRYPEELKWHKDIVYNTMWSLLVQLEIWNEKVDNEEEKIKKVLMTGLGTGVGKVPPVICARQMALAVKHFLYARSEEGQRTWTENDYVSWDKVLDLAEEVSKN
jgi:O-acetyl-ADP-ribose deacetylase (regulator of RNase III)